MNRCGGGCSESTDGKSRNDHISCYSGSCPNRFFGADTIDGMNDEPDSTPQDGQPEQANNDNRRAKNPEHLLLWTIEDVAAMCGISRSTAHRHLKEKPWSYRHRIGSELRFSEADIQAIQAMYRQAASPSGPRARSTRTGTERQKARNRAYNIRNGLREPPVSL